MIGAVVVAVLLAGGAAPAAPDAPCRGHGDCADGETCVRPVGQCGGRGACQVVADVLCPHIFAPACGCDHRSYPSDCHAQYGEGMDVAHLGACCTGACSRLDRVGIGDLVIGVGQGLGEVGLYPCRSFDRDQSQRVTIDEVISGVWNALHDGCR